MSSSKLTYKVLITPTDRFGKFSNGYKRLKEAGCEPIKAPYPYPLKEKQLMKVIQGIDGVIVGTDEVTTKVICRADKLKVISNHGVGVDNVDVEEATKRGIVVTNGPDTNKDSVADLTLGFILSLARKISELDKGFKEKRRKKIEELVGLELKGKILGVIGAGRIGKEVIKRARGFGMKILVYKRCKDTKLARSLNFEYASLHRLLQNSDFVSLHLPLTKETKGIIGKKEIKLMKRSAYLINTARGLLVDEVALFYALKNKKIAGAAVDVYPHEPPTKSPLLELDNIVATPHMGANTQQAIRNMDVVAVENVIRVLKEEKPLASVNFHLIKNKKKSLSYE